MTRSSCCETPRLAEKMGASTLFAGRPALTFLLGRIKSMRCVCKAANCEAASQKDFYRGNHHSLLSMARRSSYSQDETPPLHDSQSLASPISSCMWDQIARSPAIKACGAVILEAVAHHPSRLPGSPLVLLSDQADLFSYMLTPDGYQGGTTIAPPHHDDAVQSEQHDGISRRRHGVQTPQQRPPLFPMQLGDQSGHAPLGDGQEFEEARDVSQFGTDAASIKGEEQHDLRGDEVLQLFGFDGDSESYDCASRMSSTENVRKSPQNGSATLGSKAADTPSPSIWEQMQLHRFQHKSSNGRVYMAPGCRRCNPNTTSES